MQAGRLAAALDRITRVRGVLGAMFVAADDGLVVSEALMEGIRGNAVAALAASLAQRLGRAAGASGVGDPSFVHLAAERGGLLLLPAPQELLLVVVTDGNVNVGLARLEMARAAAEVA
jgi:predicted regulator of Ras-like GTPase activity (Roadblock/LC7/MglB family)